MTSTATRPAETLEPYWPRDGRWEGVAPEDAGFDPAVLSAAVAQALADASVGVIVLRGGRIVAEAYAPTWGPERAFELASVAKGVVAALVGVAIDEGLISGLDQSAANFIPAWRGTPKAAITLRHMMSMASGVDFEGLKVREVAGDQFQINAAAPLAHPPGTRWAYDTPTFHLLYHLIARASGGPFEAFAHRALIGPLGMERWSWLTGDGRGPNGSVTNYYSALCSTRDLARLGLFALRGGRWDGRQLVSAGFFEAAVSPSQDLNPAYGLLWWTNARPGFGISGGEAGHRFEDLPRDAFAALGFRGQMALVVPSLDLVVVRQGEAPRDPKTPERLAAAVAAAIGA